MKELIAKEKRQVHHSHIVYYSLVGKMPSLTFRGKTEGE